MPSPPIQSSSPIQASPRIRARRFLGLTSAALVMGGFFLVLHRGGWHLHDATGPGKPVHHLYLQATTISWLGIVTCQIGTAFAARTDRVQLRGSV